MPIDIVYIKSLIDKLENDLVLLKNAVKEFEKSEENRNQKHQRNRIALDCAQQWYRRYVKQKESK